MNLIFSYGAKDDEILKEKGLVFLGAGKDKKGKEIHVWRKKEEEDEKHRIFYQSTGIDIGDTCQAFCTCGWRGQEISAHNNWQMSLVREQADEHIRKMKGEKT